MSFAGSNGSRSRSASRSPYHERAKASSRSPGPPPKSQSFFISVQPRAMRPESAVPRNLLLSNQSPARSPSKAKLDVKEPSTPTKNFEVQQENVCFSHHEHYNKECDALPSRKGRVATPIKTPKPCTGAAATPPAFSPSRPYCGSPKYQKVLVERPALYYNSQAGTAISTTTEAGSRTTSGQSGKIEVTIAQLQNRIKKFMQQDENLPMPKSAAEVSWNSTTKVSISSDHERSSPKVHRPRKTCLSPLPHTLKVHKGGIAFTAGVEEPPPARQKLLSPRPDFLGKQRPHRRLDLMQNPDFFAIGDEPGRDSVPESMDSPKAGCMVISKLSRANATRVDDSSTPETAKMVPLLNHVALPAKMSCNNVAEMMEEVEEATTSSECLSQCTARVKSSSLIAEKILSLNQGSLVAQLDTSNVVDSTSEIDENPPLVAQTSSNNVVDSNKVKEKSSSMCSSQKACIITEEFAHGEGEAVAQAAAAVQTMGSDCPVDPGIEEEDEIDVHEFSSHARFLMGMVFGIMLAGLVFVVLLASGSQGLLPQKWHDNPLESSWQKSSTRKSVLEMSKSIEGLWEDCGSTTQHPIVDLVALCEGYAHAKMQVYLLVQRIQCEHFKGFAASYVGGYPSLSLSATIGDHDNLDETMSSGGFWNHHLTSILQHFRTVGGQLATKVSEMASNITLDSVKSWVPWKLELEATTSTDAVPNSSGESRECVKNAVASVMVVETSSSLQESAAPPLEMPSNVVANNKDDASLLHALLKAEVHTQVTIDASVPTTRSAVVEEGNWKASIHGDAARHQNSEFSTAIGRIQTDLSPKAREIMGSDASGTEQIDSLGLTSFVGQDITIVRDEHAHEILVQELFVEGIDDADTATSQVLHHESAAEESLVQEMPSYVIIAMGSSFVVAAAVAISFTLKWQRTSAHAKGEMQTSVKEDKGATPAASAAEPLPPPIPTVTWTTMTPAYHNLPTDRPNIGAISSPAYKVMTPGKFGLQEISTVYNKGARPATSTPTRLDRPASLMLEKPTLSVPTGFNTKLGYVSERPTIRTPLRTYTPSTPYAPSESSASSTGSGSRNGSEISSSNRTGSGSETNSVIESQLSMQPDESLKLGSFTAYEPVAITEGPGVEQIKLTPVRRSSRIRSQVSSPAHFA